MKKEGFFFTLFLVGFVAAVLFRSLHFDPETRLMPVFIATGSLMLGLTALLGEVFPRVQKLFEVDLFERQARFSSSTSLSGRWKVQNRCRDIRKVQVTQAEQRP